ncbi:MAG: hydrogenase [Elusimicrobia bacterium]|nr:hydrogenase [Elusimicrobiota bacterium]
MTSIAAHCRPVAELPLRDAREWVAKVRSALEQGERLVTLFGRKADAEGAVLTAVLQAGGGELHVLRAATTLEQGWHTLTRDFPAAQCFEREVHEQLGVRIADHPWLKPIRFEGKNLRKMKDYPFYKLAGKEVHEVAVGPIHAGIIEPGSFRFMCLGETVHHLEIQLGYQHRGVEALLLRGDPRSLAPLVETIAGDTSIGHAWAYCAAIEALAGLSPREEIEASRAVGLELERIAMHLSGLSGLASDIGFQQGASSYGRLRTTAINTSMRLCGSRFGRGWLRPGGSRAAMDAGVAEIARANLSLIGRDVAIINDCFLSALTVQHRFQGVGTVTKQQALELGLVGMAARASGVPIDQRSFGAGSYGRIPMKTSVEESGDCWARALLRIREIDCSLQWLTAALDRFPAFAPVCEAVGALAPGQFVVSVCEGWRGEIVHCLETDGLGKLLHYKVQDPSLRNWFGLALALRRNEISDFPICNKSFDLSYCGNDL